jgi:hypothetical protein
MKITDIDKLKRDTENNNLFDLTKLTFKLSWTDVNYTQYRVKKGEEMRIDLICNSIYGDVNNIDILLNIKEGSIILYPSIEQIDNLRPKEVPTENKQKLLANKDKSTKVDSSRQAYVEANYNLPPTVMDMPTEQTKVAGGLATVGTGLFNK